MPQSNIQHKVCMNDASGMLAEWGKYCCDVCENELEDNPTVIGGMNED